MTCIATQDWHDGNWALEVVDEDTDAGILAEESFKAMLNSNSHEDEQVCRQKSRLDCLEAKLETLRTKTKKTALPHKHFATSEQEYGRIRSGIPFCKRTKIGCVNSQFPSNLALPNAPSNRRHRSLFFDGSKDKNGCGGSWKHALSIQVGDTLVVKHVF